MVSSIWQRRGKYRRVRSEELRRFDQVAGGSLHVVAELRLAHRRRRPTWSGVLRVEVRRLGCGGRRCCGGCGDVVVELDHCEGFPAPEAGQEWADQAMSYVGRRLVRVDAVAEMLAVITDRLAWLDAHAEKRVDRVLDPEYRGQIEAYEDMREAIARAPFGELTEASARLADAARGSSTQLGRLPKGVEA